LLRKPSAVDDWLIDKSTGATNSLPRQRLQQSTHTISTLLDLKTHQRFVFLEKTEKLDTQTAI